MAKEGKISRLGNIKEQLSDGSTRIRFFGGLAVILVAAIVGYISLRSSVSTSASGTPSQVPPAPNVTSQRTPENGIPQATPAYDKLLEQENAAAAAAARATGESAIPVLRPGAGQKAAEAPAQPVQQSQAPAQQAAEAAAAQQQYQEAVRRHQDAVNAKVPAMKNQVNLLIASWQPKDHVTLSVREAAKDGGAAPASGNTGGSVPSSSPASGGGATGAARTIARAGDRFYVEKDDVVNSGGTPVVTATIQNGVLKGTKIIGKVELPQNSDSAILKFHTANVEGYPTSQAIDAIAIDPGFIDVDHHYLMRYAALFGSSFLSGYGEGLLKGGQNQQAIASPSGIVIQTDPYSTKQLVQIGIGNMGKAAGTNLGELVNRPSTVKVTDKAEAGGLGILLMSDMTLK